MCTKNTDEIPTKKMVCHHFKEEISRNWK